MVRRQTTKDFLNRDMIIGEAIAMIDRSGIDELSMRGLAKSLSVSVSTLYWHVTDKQELLRLIVDDSLRSIQIHATGDWRPALTEFMFRSRDLLRQRPVLIRLIWTAGWDLGPQSLRLSNDVVGLIAASGVPEDEVADTYYMLIAFLFGFVALEVQSPNTPGFTGTTAQDDVEPSRLDNLIKYSPAADLAGMDRRFERGVAKLLDSIAIE